MQILKKIEKDKNIDKKERKYIERKNDREKYKKTGKKDKKRKAKRNHLINQLSPIKILSKNIEYMLSL